MHLAQQEIQRFDDDALEGRFARNEPDMQICQRKLRVVVKHLLEMWNAPEIVGGITGEAAADYVVHATARHGFEGMGCGFQASFSLRRAASSASKQKFDCHRLRKFGGAAPAAVAPII